MRDEPTDSGSAVPEEQAHRILARAAELDAKEGPTIPLAHLREIAREAGISATAIEDAIHEIGATREAGVIPRAWSRVASWLSISPLGPLSALTINVLAFAAAWVLVSLSVTVASLLGGNWVVTYGVVIVASLAGLGLAVKARARLTAVLLAILAAAQLAEYPIRLIYGFGNTLQEVGLMLAAGFGLLLSRVLAQRPKAQGTLPPVQVDQRTAVESTPPTTSTTDHTSLRLRPISA